MTKLNNEGLTRSEVIARNRIRRKAQSSVQDAFSLKLRLPGKKLRAIYRHLNDTIGMGAYEVAMSRPMTDNTVSAELWLPGKSLALIIKLTYGGA